MLTNVHEYEYQVESPILSPLAKTAYLAVARIVFLLNVSFFCQIFRSKSEKVKTSLKWMFCSPFLYSFIWNSYFFIQITSLSIEYRLKLKCSEDQILDMKSNCVY